MHELIVSNLQTYGPCAVFLLLLLSGFGVPIGEEWVLIPAGALVYSGQFEFWSVAPLAYCGIILADFIWYAICYHYGTPLLHKRWVKKVLHPRRLLQIKHQIERRGIGVIIVARFVPATRSAAITMGGVLHMPFWKFALAEMSCVLITVPIQLGIGFFAAKGLAAASQLEWIFHIVGGAILALVAALIARRWYLRRHRTDRLPRARMSWLRRSRRTTRPTGIHNTPTIPASSTSGPATERDASSDHESSQPNTSSATQLPSHDHASTRPLHR